MPRLGVNIDHVATLRQVRWTSYPDPLEAALLAEKGGADQITCHLREDRRHIQDADLPLLRKKIKTRLNLEMAATEEMVRIAQKIKPDLVTLVPEKRQELTTEGGLDLKKNFSKFRKTIEALAKKKIPVSLFIYSDLEAVSRSLDLGAVGFEIHTGCYAEAKNRSEMKKEYRKIVQAAELGKKLKLGVYAGHGLHYQNISPLVQIREIEEYNIGHAIIARALFVGLPEAVREMKEKLNAV